MAGDPSQNCISEQRHSSENLFCKLSGIPTTYWLWIPLGHRRKEEHWRTQARLCTLYK
jgi:hypothetical protein